MTNNNDELIPYEELVRRQEQAKLTETKALDNFLAEKAARAFATELGDDWRHVDAWGFWLKWNGRYWQRERTQLVTWYVRRVIAQLVKQDRRRVSGNLVAIVERLAQSNREQAREAGIWDADPFVLNTQSGTLDLRSGRLDVFNRDDHLTKIAGATPRGDCPLWRKFLERITGGALELQAYLQRLAGYCLTGSTSEQKFFFAWGTGGNGKSVFLNVLSSVVGDYATSAASTVFLAQRIERHPTELADLRGYRLVTSSEVPQRAGWNTERLFGIVAGDPVKARHMRQDLFEFTPQCKLLFAGNHKPSFRTVNEATRRRLHLLPFIVTIPRDQRDPDLTAKLLAEHDGILSWAVQGCLDWQREGLNPPTVITEATEEYLAGEDTLDRWLAECCEQGPYHRAASRALFAAWKTWAEANGEHVGSQQALVQALQDKGFRPFRTNSARGLLKLRPISETPEELPL